VSHNNYSATFIRTIIPALFNLTEALLDIRVRGAIHSRPSSKELFENIGGGEQV
jgi:hypothetical protein